MKEKKKVFYILAFIFLVIISFIASTRPQEIQMISYLEYQSLVEEKKIDVIKYNDSKEYMTIYLQSEITQSMSDLEKINHVYENSQLRKVIYPAGDNFKKELLEQGIIVKEETDNFANASKYVEILVFAILLGGFFLLIRKGSPMGSATFAQKAIPEEINVTFDDVIGHEEVKGDLQLLVKQLKKSSKDLSHGVLFEGSPGTGKTMLAKAIAKEAGVNFISVNSSNLIEMYVGLGAKRVRQAFEQARKQAPCVLFFDEIDAVGAKRGSQRSHRENDQTINALLTELDGFSDKGNVLVIGATNRADNLDEALLRSGRFDRKIKIDIPKKWETRQELFEHYLEDQKDETVDTENLAKQTTGFSGADISAICREAKLIAFREDKTSISHDFLEEAIDKMIFKGNRSNEEQHKKDVERVAYHEAGHAVMSLILNRPISRISIKGMTSGVGGAVFQTDSNSVFQTKADMEEQIMIAYSGRVSEEIKYGKENVTQGASNDITQATKLLMLYVGKYGFDNETGLIDCDVFSETSFTQNENLLKRVSAISSELYSKTLTALRNEYNKVEKLAQKILKTKTMSGEEVKKLLTA